MNTFLQRMLKRNSTEELNTESDSEEQRSSRDPRGYWIRKLGNCSPSKYQIPGSPVLKTSAMKALDCASARETMTPEKKDSSRAESPLEMPDLESIIREFERGFLSPSKHDASSGSGDGSKQKNFVKKIVAAFEVKYKTYNETRDGSTEAGSKLEGSTLAADSCARRSTFLASPFRVQSSVDEPRTSPLKRGTESPEASEAGVFPLRNAETLKRLSGIFGSPFKLSFDETGDEDCSVQVAGEDRRAENRRSGIFFQSPGKEKSSGSLFSSPFARSSSSSKDTSRSSTDIYTSPLDLERQDSRDSSSDCSSLFKFDKEASSRRANFNFNASPPRMSSLDDTKTMDSIDVDVTLPEPEETIFLDEEPGQFSLQKTSTMIQEFSTDEEVTAASRSKPKIVGAFLKRPIEVEDTSIDWIPITGKKLPRKRSLKKLLYSLTGRKYEKKNKLYSSERNLNEEPRERELQDSGYDERSCSSSSLTSLLSITEVLLQQENSYIEPERRATALRTFRSRNSLDREEEEEEEDEAFYDTYRTTGKPSRRKLLLTEVPREDLKLDLGPCYPATAKMVTMSLDRKSGGKKNGPSPSGTPFTNRVPKHPFLSKIPKHPFVSLTKMDERQDQPIPCPEEEPGRCCEESVIVKNDLYEVEFRRSCDDVRGSPSDRSSTYDVPRRFLSKSENELRTAACEPVVLRRRRREPIYDVPRSRAADRPRSSVFEDALSLKRRSHHLAETVAPPFSMYATPRELECRYATVKPRNTRLYLNQDTLRSFSDLSCAENRAGF